MLSKTAFRGLVVLSAVVPIMGVTTPAWAAKPAKGGSATSTTGIDVSWPQCPGTSLPSGEAFAIVGVNGGLANDYNSCLSTEFAYAQHSTGAVASQPKAQLYLNTGDPGNTVADWPSTDNLGAYGRLTSTSSLNPQPPSGTCLGGNSPICAYIYGYDMVLGGIKPTDATTLEVGDVTDFSNSTGDSLYDFPTWLDVETANTWQSGLSGQAMNVADLQGMVAGYNAAASTAGVVSAPIGIYSTSYQWGQITGAPGSSATGLWGIPDWIPGARSAKGAASNCSLASFTNSGYPIITQWFGHPYDGDYSCTT